MKTHPILRSIVLAACVAASGFAAHAQNADDPPADPTKPKAKGKTRGVRSNAPANASASATAVSDSNGRTRIIRSSSSSSSSSTEPITRTVTQHRTKKVDMTITSREVTYIGVVANDLLPIVREQLGIPAGTGLAVEMRTRGRPRGQSRHPQERHICCDWTIRSSSIRNSSGCWCGRGKAGDEAEIIAPEKR